VLDASSSQWPGVEAEVHRLKLLLEKAVDTLADCAAESVHLKAHNKTLQAQVSPHPPRPTPRVSSLGDVKSSLRRRGSSNAPHAHGRRR
jgi:hypothetical protein